MGFTINFDENKNSWNDFAKCSPQYSIFVDTIFLDSLGHPYQCITIHEEGKILAGCVLFIDENGNPLRKNLSYTQFQGLILSNMDDLPVHSRFNRQLEILGFFIEKLCSTYEHYFLSQSWKFEDIRAFLWHNYHDAAKSKFSYSIKYTALLELSEINSRPDFLASIRKLRKREYQRALKEGYVVEDCNDISLLIDLHDTTFQRQGITVTDKEKECIMAIAASAINNGYGKIMITTKPGQKATSATLFLYDRTCGYYLIGANNPDFRSSGSSTLLMIENIYRCKEMNLKYVDFVGVNSPNRGDFKTSFNAVPKCYFELSI